MPGGTRGQLLIVMGAWRPARAFEAAASSRRESRSTNCKIIDFYAVSGSSAPDRIDGTAAVVTIFEVQKQKVIPVLPNSW